MKRFISIITSIMVTLSFTLPAELVFAEENLAPETEHVVEQETSAATEEPTAYVPNEVIVVFESKTALKKAETTAENAVAETEGSEVAENIEVGTISNTDKAVLVQSDENIDELALCEELEDQKGVAFAQPNFLYEFDEAETQEVISELMASTGQWNLNAIQAKDAWDYIDGLRSRSYWKNDKHQRVKVAVLDTGAKLNLSDFSDYNNGGNMDFANSTTLNDIGGHGTKVTSVIAATNNGIGFTGVAAGNHNELVQVMSIDIYSQKSADIHAAKTSDVINGINLAMCRGAQVIQMCMGHLPNQKDYTKVPQNDALLESKINEAVNSGIVVTASAGNNKGETTWYPSDFESVISVINSNINGVRDSSSNYGLKKDIAAPGTKVPVLLDTGKTDEQTGTSYAAPTVAGVAAMVLYVDPALTVDEVKTVLYTTTTGYNGEKSAELGWGIVNAYNAVNKAADDATKHSYNQKKVEAKYLKHSASCTSPAEYYTSCSECGKSSKGTDWESSFTDGEKLPHNKIHLDYRDSTCTEYGNIECYYCARCGKHFSDEECENEYTDYSWRVPLKEHSYFTVDAGNGCTHQQCSLCGHQKDFHSPSYVKSFKVKKGTKKFTAKWKKQSKKNQKKFSGYQLRWSTNPDMSGAGYKYVSKKKSSVTIKGKKKTYYYVQLRSYTGAYYSDWSAVKKVKTR